VLEGAGRARAPEDYPLDGITWPKAQHAAEIDWLVEVLRGAERALGLPENRLRVQLMVESGWAVLHLGELVHAAGPRLCGVVFGIADYSADLGLVRIRNDHPTCDWARAAIVNAAGAAGVPAIDAMTMNYPAPDPARDPLANRRHILDRVRECYEDTMHGVRLGMAGKWAGHPLQLLAVLLAHRLAVAPATLALDIQAVEAYAAAVADERGTALVAGAMSDRATDRQRRTRLRRAVALGQLDVQRGLALGIITPAEAATLAR
jgi:citrate lyase beta subunit